MTELTASSSAIAERVGVSKQVVSLWRSGAKRPGPPKRAALAEAYGIDPRMWDAVAVEPTEDPTAMAGRLESLVVAAESGNVRTCLDDCLALLASIRKERETADLLPSERVKLADSETRTLSLRARLEEKLELLEDRIVREHPFWLRIRGALLESLKDHPAAARDVIASLSRIGAL